MSLPIITPLRKRQLGLYSDFHKNLTINPLTNDLARLLDESAINESLRNLIMTNRGERLFQPNLGSDIRATLFENNTPATLTILKQHVIDLINNFEPSVTIIDVTVYSNYDEYTVNIVIEYYIRNKEVPITLTISLERIR